MSRYCILLLLVGLASALTVPLAGEQAPFRLDTNAPADLPYEHSTPSFWMLGPNANPLAEAGSTGAFTDAADVCIVGSGMTGTSAAYHLANAVEGGRFPLPEGKERLRAVVLEARDFCSGATGRNGGNLTPFEIRGFREVEKRFGREEALRYFAIEHYSSTEMARIAREGGWADSVDLVEGGHVDLLQTEEQVDELWADFDAAVAAGKSTNVSWFSREEMNATYGTYNWGIRTPGYNVWPLKFVTELFKEANSTTDKLDLRLHTQTPVTKVSPLSLHSEDKTSFPTRWALSTPRGEVHCSYVLHATNAYASHLLPHLAGSIVPVRGQVVALRASAPASALTKVSWIGGVGYWFPRPVEEDERPIVIFGGARDAAGPPFEVGTTDDGSVNEAVGKVLRGFLSTLFPTLYEEGREPEREWTGIMGYTPERDVPFVGPVLKYEGQFISAGYGGHGMPRAYACAEAIVGMIAAELEGRDWVLPEWMPRPFLTSS
ncbi:FAD dependent oxidoreductase [Roridomyces roridus]|uniref:FAD dependent oxidoreductase n=1 Tax=Roridomyces roridus TaxID=1738132 RepID=A0AAD7FIE8_9AGAR|nr:FAD dependent oxidoreductase [Roridomyces roridus]